MLPSGMQPRDWALVAALLALASWSLWDRWMQAKEMRRVQSALDALVARQDRLQALLEGRNKSWGDSLDFTKFNWEQPGPF